MIQGSRQDLNYAPAPELLPITTVDAAFFDSRSSTAIPDRDLLIGGETTNIHHDQSPHFVSFRLKFQGHKLNHERILTVSRFV